MPETSGPSGGDTSSTLRFDRRSNPRAARAGHAIATFVSEGSGSRLLRVQLLDSSKGGLGVRADTPIEPGTLFGLFPDDVSAPAMHGKVVRCTFEDGGYRLGLQRLMREAA